MAVEEKFRVDPSDPATFPKFIDHLTVPPLATPEKTYDYHSQDIPYYKIMMKEVRHRFHKLFPTTRIWGYNGMSPGPTIEASKDAAVHVRWVNSLPEKHLIPVDKTLHGTIDTPEVRTVVHLHGANVAADSDGHPDAWYSRNYEAVGHAFTRRVYKYTNHQPGTTLWYHDHAVGITRLNVYAGLAGFYLIRDRLEERLNLPRGPYEIPLMIQDKAFNEDGSLFYPDNATPPVNKPVPSTPSFFIGNTIAVNGKLWPYLNVEPRKYRFRILNASNLRAYGLSLSNGGIFHQIGTDQGLLQNSVEIDSFVLEPAERIDLIIDFSQYRGQEITLVNGEGSTPPADADTGVIMKFRVVLPLKRPDTSDIPEDLFPYHPINPSLAYRERTLHLDETVDRYGRVMHLLDDRMWHDPVTEIVKKDTIEIWHLVNHFDFPHPIHVHLVDFEILGRKPFTVADFDKKGNYKYVPQSLSPPEIYERGLKDVVRATPGEVTTIAMHFKEHTGDYIWHCHILEHEDNDMMRPLKVVD
ncbi:MAG: multicopper oxidase domain-containing protein [Clostridia bacterium]|nr:multicopper oxidase domain-containing protein [Clostridia bacterium]